MIPITFAEFIQIVPEAKKGKLDLSELIVSLNDAFADTKCNLDTLNRRSAFIAQCAHESAHFTRVVENLNYSKDALLRIFKKYFPNEQLAQLYARNPQKIANLVYANRMGNGDEKSGDGWKYRGRGFIQLTGKFNYVKCGNALEMDLVDDPDYLTTIEGAVESAIWFWNQNLLYKFADRDDIVGMTKRVNGGTHGLQERNKYYIRAKDVLGKRYGSFRTNR